MYKKRELFQSDVVFFTQPELVEANNGYKYLFTTIDVFSKIACMYPMYSGREMTLARSGITPPDAWTLSCSVDSGGTHAEIHPEEEDMGKVLTKHTIGRV